MGTYTLELNEILDLHPNTAPAEVLGLDKYPIFDESYRETLNQKIIDHFWNQEMGQETISMFRLAMKRCMNEIMPYYNQLYQSERYTQDPFQTVNVKNFTRQETAATTADTGKQTTDTDVISDSTTTSSSDAKSRAVSSLTPQTRLAGNADYADSAQDNISQTNAESAAHDASGTTQEQTTSANSTSEQDGTTDQETTGFQGDFPSLLMNLRQTFLNVDMMIISDIQRHGLFMLIWSNTDSYTERTNHGIYGFRFPL